MWQQRQGSRRVGAIQPCAHDILPRWDILVSFWHGYPTRAGTSSSSACFVFFSIAWLRISQLVLHAPVSSPVRHQDKVDVCPLLFGAESDGRASIVKPDELALLPYDLVLPQSHWMTVKRDCLFIAALDAHR